MEVKEDLAKITSPGVGSGTVGMFRYRTANLGTRTVLAVASHRQCLYVFSGSFKDKSTWGTGKRK